MCTEDRYFGGERAQSLCGPPLRPLPTLAEGSLYQLWWKILDGLSKFCSCLRVQRHVFLLRMSVRGTELSTELAAVLTGDNTTIRRQQRNRSK